MNAETKKALAAARERKRNAERAQILKDIDPQYHEEAMRLFAKFRRTKKTAFTKECKKALSALPEHIRPYVSLRSKNRDFLDDFKFDTSAPAIEEESKKAPRRSKRLSRDDYPELDKSKTRKFSPKVIDSDDMSE